MSSDVEMKRSKPLTSTTSNTTEGGSCPAEIMSDTATVADLCCSVNVVQDIQRGILIMMIDTEV